MWGAGTSIALCSDMRALRRETLVLLTSIMLAAGVGCTGEYVGAGGGGGGGGGSDAGRGNGDDGLGEGDPNDPGDPGDPADPPADAGLPGSPDAAPQGNGGEQGECLVQSSYGALGTLPQQAATLRAQQNAAGNVYRLTAQLDAVTNDYLVIELWEGYGALAANGQLTPGTYTIGAQDSDYDTCGACVMLSADFDPQTGNVAKRFIATAGTVTVTNVNGNLAGSVSGIAFKERDPQTNAPLAGSTCASAMASGSFDATLQ